MKKKDLFLLILLGLLVLLLISFLFKRRISSNKFISICDKNHFQSIDLSKQYNSSQEIEKAVICESENNWQIEYFSFHNTDDAKKMYDTNFDEYKLNLKQSSFSKKKDLLYYSEFSLIYQNKYLHVCRIRNTIVYTKVPLEYKEEAIKMIKKIGY